MAAKGEVDQELTEQQDIPLIYELDVWNVAGEDNVNHRVLELTSPALHSALGHGLGAFLRPIWFVEEAEDTRLKRVNLALLPVRADM